MTLRFKPTALLLGGAVLALAVLTAVVLLVMPPPHRPFEYMIAGTAATAIALAVAFGLVHINKG